MVAPFTTALYDLMHYIELNWENLVNDIRLGRLDEDVNIPDELRKKFNSSLSPDPKRIIYLKKDTSISLLMRIEKGT